MGGGPWELQAIFVLSYWFCPLHLLAMVTSDRVLTLLSGVSIGLLSSQLHLVSLLKSVSEQQFCFAHQISPRAGKDGCCAVAVACVLDVDPKQSQRCGFSSPRGPRCERGLLRDKTPSSQKPSFSLTHS